MRFRSLRGWGDACRMGRNLRPDLPSEAFDAAGSMRAEFWRRDVPATAALAVHLAEIVARFHLPCAEHVGEA